MAVYTKINSKEINYINKIYNIGKIIEFTGIKKGIENTNYLIKTKNKKFILTIFEKRVQKKDLPFFMNLMFGLYKLKIKCPEPIKNKNGKYLFKINNKSACLVSYLKGKDKKELNYNECFIVGKNIGTKKHFVPLNMQTALRITIKIMLVQWIADLSLY